MRRLLATALLLGVAADLLLHVDSWRAGFVLWLLVVLAAIAALAPAANDEHRVERRWLLGAAAVLALLLVLRDAPMLYALDMGALVLVLLLVAWRTGARRLAELEPRDALIGGIAGASAIALGAPMAVAGIRPASGTIALPSRRSAVLTAAIGTIGAVPVLLVATALLSEGDAAFASFLTRLEGSLDGALGHVTFAAAATWVSVGVLVGAGERLGVRDATLRAELRAPFAAVVPLLGGLAAILGTWVELQLRVLFGGARYLAQTVGVSAANYARDGFFQLVVVAGLVLASAMHRLLLYVDAFGLTEDRVFGFALLVWVALVFAWFAVTVLRARRARFAPGVLVISALWLASLNVANPERWIVRGNVSRALAGAPFDAPYHAKLSADAVPSLLDALETLPTADAAALRAALDDTWRARAIERGDWRRWSLPYRSALARTGRALHD